MTISNRSLQNFSFRGVVVRRQASDERIVQGVREVGKGEICEREIFEGRCPLAIAEASEKGYNLDGEALVRIVP